LSARARGFTLIEVVVALALVGVAGVAALSAFGATLWAAGRSESRLTAAALAEERLGRLALLTATEARRLPDSLRAGRFGPPFEAYVWAARTQPVRDLPDLIEVAVTVASAEDSFPLRTRWYRPPPLGRP